MTNIISPFRIESSKVTDFHLTQKDDDSPANEIRVSIGIDYDLSEIKIENINEVESYSAQANLKVNIDGKTDKNKKIFSIKLIMVGLFQGDTNAFDEAKFIQMLKINGVTTLMQLSRAYITSVTAISGFNRPINFPMVNIMALIKMKDNASEEK